MVLVVSGLVTVLILQLVVGYLGTQNPEQTRLFWYIQIALFLILIALFVAAIACVQRCFLKPLVHLRNWASQVRSGNWSARVPETQSREFSELAHDINDLSAEMQTMSSDVESLVNKQTGRLREKKQSLELLYDMAASINSSRDLSDLLGKFLKTLKDLIGAEAACVRLLTPEGDMELIGSIGLDEVFVKREKLMPANVCLCGDVMGSGRMECKSDLRSCDITFAENNYQTDELQLLVIPLQYQEKVLGVYNLFVAHGRAVAYRENEELLTSIGRHLGVAIEKARLDQDANRLSRIEERTLLANELHDSFAQTLASLRIHVRILDETLHQDDECMIWEQMELVEDSLEEANSELRQLIAQFRRSDDLSGLLPDIEHVVSRFRREIDATIFFQNQWKDIDLPVEYEHEVTGIIQEALNNIRKHSRAHTVRILLSSGSDSEYRVLIEDDGIGFDTLSHEGTSESHFGLTIMRERAERINGHIQIETEPDDGTRIELEFICPDIDQRRVAVHLGSVSR